jgi:hypothetical protein
MRSNSPTGTTITSATGIGQNFYPTTGSTGGSAAAQQLYASAQNGSGTGNMMSPSSSSSANSMGNTGNPTNCSASASQLDYSNYNTLAFTNSISQHHHHHSHHGANDLNNIYGQHHQY